jgi:hypothetical protein
VNLESNKLAIRTNGDPKAAEKFAKLKKCQKTVFFRFWFSFFRHSHKQKRKRKLVFLHPSSGHWLEETALQCVLEEAKKRVERCFSFLATRTIRIRETTRPY